MNRIGVLMKFDCLIGETTIARQPGFIPFIFADIRLDVFDECAKLLITVHIPNQEIMTLCCTIWLIVRQIYDDPLVS